MSPSKVTVFIRIEQDDQGVNAESAVEVKDHCILLKQPLPSRGTGNDEEHSVDYCFWSADSSEPDKYAIQEKAFSCLEQGVLENVSHGYHSCILSYKQMGSGKTFSLMGSRDQPGLIPRICSRLFNKDSSNSKTFQVEISYMEITREEVRDLLVPRGGRKTLSPLSVLGSYLMGLSQYAVTDYNDVEVLIRSGNDNKCGRDETMRPSHTIFTITVTVTDSAATNKSGDLLSKVLLVDMADGDPGEHGMKTDNLVTLESAVNSLIETSSQKGKPKSGPYEDSLLARILQESLGGNCSIILLATIFPLVANYYCTSAILKFADKVQQIKRQPVVNYKIQNIQDKERKLEEWHKDIRKEIRSSWDEKLNKTKEALEKSKEGDLSMTSGSPDTSGNSNGDTEYTDVQVQNSLEGTDQMAGVYNTRFTQDKEFQAEKDSTSSISAAKLESHASSFEKSTDGVAHNAPILGIFRITDAVDMTWINDLLQIYIITETFREVKIETLSDSTEDTWKLEARKCDNIILYHSMKVDLSANDMWCNLEKFLHVHGPSNVIVVIGDLKNATAEKNIREEWNEKQLSSCPLLLFTEAELDSIVPSHKRQWKMDKNIKKIVTILKHNLTHKGNKSGNKSAQETIGIFSRCAQDHYSWLQGLLRSEDLSSQVQDVRTLFINNSNRQQIIEENPCTFGILYHSNKYGRINISDVPSALYNGELEQLNKVLGNDRVLVVLDDLDDKSKEEEQILEKQPNITRLAKDLVIFRDGDESDYKTYLASAHERDEPIIQEKLDGLMTFLNIKEITDCGDEKQKAATTNHDVRIRQGATTHDYKKLEPATDSGKTPGSTSDYGKTPGSTSDSVKTPPGSTSDSGKTPPGSTSNSKNTTPGSTSDSGNTPPGSTSDSGNTPPGSTSDSGNTPPGSTSDSGNTPPGSTSDSGNTPPGSTSNSMNTTPGSTSNSMNTPPGSTSDSGNTPPGSTSDSGNTPPGSTSDSGNTPPGSTSHSDQKSSGSPNKAQDSSGNKRKAELPDPPGSHKMKRFHKPIVGIFSRSGKVNYTWLQEVLRDQFHVSDRPHFITNSGHQKFIDEVNQCSFGILYHTKKHGRLNITDVPDSIYNEQLKDLNSKLGKKNVIVVLDDLDISSFPEKVRILDQQPSISSLARDLILFSEREKQSIKKNQITPEIREKLERIKQLL